MVRKFDNFSLTRIGESHILSSKPCQDCSKSGKKGKFSYFCVSDGHGGDDYIRSNYGSKFACESFESAIEKLNSTPDFNFRNITNVPTQFSRQFCGYILSKWHEKIEMHVFENPFQKDEMADVSDDAKLKFNSSKELSVAYGATLIGGFVFEGKWFAMQIGDGEFVCVDEMKEISRPIPPDYRCHGNITTSLCDDNAIDEFRSAFSLQTPLALLACTDGVDKSFSDNLQLDSFYRKVVTRFSDVKKNDALAELADFIPTLSKKGSYDDISISGVFSKKNILASFLQADS